MKTLSRHEKVTLILVLVAIMFLVISYFGGVDKSLTGILQGLGLPIVVFEFTCFAFYYIGVKSIRYMFYLD